MIQLRRKAISSVVTAVILAIISITLVGTSYLFSKSIMEGTMAETFEIIDVFHVDVFQDGIIVRSTGTQNISKFTTLIDGKEVKNNIKDPPKPPQNVGIVNVSLKDINPGSHQLTLISRSMSQTLTLEVEEVEMETVTSTTSSTTTTISPACSNCDYEYCDNNIAYKNPTCQPSGACAWQGIDCSAQNKICKVSNGIADCTAVSSTTTTSTTIPTTTTTRPTTSTTSTTTPTTTTTTTAPSCTWSGWYPTFSCCAGAKAYEENDCIYNGNVIATQFRCGPTPCPV
jgi:hypothetical protein